MAHERRDFLKTAGALSVFGAASAIGCGQPTPDAPTTPARTLARAMARGLTLLTFRRDGTDRLGGGAHGSRHPKRA